jgi:hypothetical protein
MDATACDRVLSGVGRGPAFDREIVAAANPANLQVRRLTKALIES